MKAVPVVVRRMELVKVWSGCYFLCVEDYGYVRDPFGAYEGGLGSQKRRKWRRRRTIERQNGY